MRYVRHGSRANGLLAPVGALVIALLAAGCSGGGAATQTGAYTSPSATAAVTTTSTAPTVTPTTATASTATPTTASRTATATPTATVPVDQIPPGHPVQWVPAGVPTTAKYREPGDVVPMFSEGMFHHNAAGATVTARYFIDALNWESATRYDSTAYQIICRSSICGQFDKQARIKAGLGEKVVGARIQVGSEINTQRAPTDSGATWVVELRLTTIEGKVLNRRGALVRKIKRSSFEDALFMKWTGKMWLIIDDRTVTK